MTRNQKFIDRLIRWKIYSLGYAKSVVTRIVAILDATEPEIRKQLLDIFGPGSTGGKLAKLRLAEKRLSAIRGQAWNQALRDTFSLLFDLFELQPDVLKAASGKRLQLITLEAILGLMKKTQVVGWTLRNWFDNFKAADLRRIVGQLRVSIFGGETLTQTLRRLVGKLSVVAVAAKNNIKSIIPTAIAAMSTKVKEAVVGNNADFFDLELWVSILDSRTTKGCRDLDGKTFPRGVGIQPGYHFFCRSERIPLLMDGGTHELGSYSAWIQTQDPKFRRYAGEEEFSYAQLQPLTIEEVRSRLSGDSEED